MAITGNDGSYSIVWTPGSYVVRVAGVPNTYGEGSANATLDSAAVTDANITLSEITTERILITSTDHKIAYQIGDTLDVTNLQISAYMDRSRYLQHRAQRRQHLQLERFRAH